jgi:hypothetical protein
LQSKEGGAPSPSSSSSDASSGKQQKLQDLSAAFVNVLLNAGNTAVPLQTVSFVLCTCAAACLSVPAVSSVLLLTA